MPQIAEILLDVAHRRLDHSYHYLVPEAWVIKPGMRVLVPLQQRQVQGVVLDVQDYSDDGEGWPEGTEGKKLRPLLSVLDAKAVPSELIELARWLAQTTICSVAQSLHTVWPLLKGKVEDWIIPAADLDDGDVQAMQWLDQEVYRALQVLHRARRRALPIKTFTERSQLSAEGMERLIQTGWIRRESRFSSGWTKGFSSSVTDGMPGVQNLSPMTGILPVKQLTGEQAKAVGFITGALLEKTAQTLLLHGVTGSGKTEVYRQVIEQVLSQGGDAILLVPEISLTTQIAGYFQSRLGDQVTVLHSGLSGGEKSQAWAKILAGEKRLVIGARSAVFAPLPNLRLIIIDEEHDGAYKQDENPKYHARDVARKRMEQRQGVVLLGSATPSMEAYGAAQAGKIKLVSMGQRANLKRLPPVTVIDMRTEMMNGNRSMFSFALQDKLKEKVDKGEQAMVFLNRRGYSTFVVCRECGYVVECPHCAVALTYHTQGQMMRCHYCNHEQTVPHRCPQCASRYIRFFGQGTQRVEEELNALLPGIPILRLDTDTTRSADGHQGIIEKFRSQEAAVLVGTQMMAKGLDFPNVTLVGVVAADQLLNMPDFRARERAFQLLTQVAGRAGRSEKAGEVVIQTYSPQDRAVVKAAAHDYSGFFWEEIVYRKERFYPPFTHVIRVLIMHEKEERVIKGAHALGHIVSSLLQEGGEKGVDLLGPAPAVLSRLKNLYRWQLSVKGKDMQDLRRLLHKGVNDFFHTAESSGISLNIEVDPQG